MARPKSDKPIKEKTLQARVSLEEFAFYSEFSEQMGVNVSTLIRMALIQFCKDK
ncbi:MAG: hypothetical protein MSA56_10165 [Clostridium sp.]|nr:hypothetical protein [Clostridium sp.]